MGEAVVLVLRVGIFASKKCFPGHHWIKSTAVVLGDQDGVIIVNFMKDLVKVRIIGVQFFRITTSQLLYKVYLIS